jgi:stalled ribosome alternative rescue factor ArfA
MYENSDSDNWALVWNRFVRIPGPGGKNLIVHQQRSWRTLWFWRTIRDMAHAQRDAQARVLEHHQELLWALEDLQHSKDIEKMADEKITRDATTRHSFIDVLLGYGYGNKSKPVRGGIVMKPAPDLPDLAGKVKDLIKKWGLDKWTEGRPGHDPRRPPGARCVTYLPGDGNKIPDAVMNADSMFEWRVQNNQKGKGSNSNSANSNAQKNQKQNNQGSNQED